MINSIRRHFSSLAITECRKLVYKTHGDPAKVLSLVTEKLPDTLEPSQLLVKHLACPINPSDINQIQGVYPIKPDLPAVGGNEGVGEVVRVGSEVKSVNVGDWVIPALAGQGTWRTASIVSEGDVWRLPNNQLSVAAAATILVNPSTAYRMLHDFVQLEPGDSVIQNGGNSSVGVYVIQLCRELGLKCISLVRDRSDIDDRKRELVELGASLVLTEESLKSDDARKAIASLPAPKLALNCVGGRSSLYLASNLAPGGKMVTYGGMSRQPAQAPTAALIFNNISLHGFWMSHWYTYPEHQTARRQMMDFLCDRFSAGKLKAPSRMDQIPMEKYSNAVAGALEPGANKKLFVFEGSDVNE